MLERNASYAYRSDLLDASLLPFSTSKKNAIYEIISWCSVVD